MEVRKHHWTPPWLPRMYRGLLSLGVILCFLAVAWRFSWWDGIGAVMLLIIAILIPFVMWFEEPDGAWIGGVIVFVVVASCIIGATNWFLVANPPSHQIINYGDKIPIINTEVYYLQKRYQHRENYILLVWDELGDDKIFTNWVLRGRSEGKVLESVGGSEYKVRSRFVFNNRFLRMMTFPWRFDAIYVTDKNIRFNQGG